MDEDRQMMHRSGQAAIKLTSDFRGGTYESFSYPAVCPRHVFVLQCG